MTELIKTKGILYIRKSGIYNRYQMNLPNSLLRSGLIKQKSLSCTVYLDIKNVKNDYDTNIIELQNIKTESDIINLIESDDFVLKCLKNCII